MQPTDLQRPQAPSLPADGTQQIGPPAAKRSRGAGGAVVTEAGAGLAERRVSPPIDSGAAAAAARPAASSSSSAAAAAAAASAAGAVAVPAPAPLSLYFLLREPNAVIRRRKLINIAVANLAQQNLYLPVSHSAAARAAVPCTQAQILLEVRRLEILLDNLLADAARRAVSSSSSAAAAAAAAASAARRRAVSSSSSAAAAAAASAAGAVAVPAPAPAPLSLYSLLREPNAVIRRQKLINIAVANLVQQKLYLAVSHSAAARAAVPCAQVQISLEVRRLELLLDNFLAAARPAASSSSSAAASSSSSAAAAAAAANPRNQGEIQLEVDWRVMSRLPSDVKLEILSYLPEKERASLYSQSRIYGDKITTQEAEEQEEQNVLTTRQLRERVVRPKNVFRFAQFEGDKSTAVWDYWDTHDKKTFSFFSHDELGLSLDWVQVIHLDKIIKFFEQYPDKAAKLKGLKFKYFTSAQSNLGLLAEGIHDRLFNLLNLFPNLERVELSMSTAAQFAKGDLLKRADWLGRVKDFTLNSGDVRMTADELSSFLIHMPNLEKLDLSHGSFAAFPTDLELPSLKEFTRLNEFYRSSGPAYHLGPFVAGMRNLEKLHLNTTDPFVLPGDAGFPQLRELIMHLPHFLLDKAPNLERLEILKTYYNVNLSGDFMLNKLRQVILPNPHLPPHLVLQGLDNFNTRHPRAKWMYRS